MYPVGAMIIENRNESRLRRGTCFFTESRNRGDGDRDKHLPLNDHKHGIRWKHV